MEDAKLQNLIVELVFFLHVAINKALPVSTQSFASFVYKIKHIQAEIYDLLPKNLSGFGAKIQHQSVLVPSHLITTAEKLLLRNKGQITCKTIE